METARGKAGAALTCLCALLLPLGSAAAPAKLSGVLPADGAVGGWQRIAEPQSFDADNLFEHINGAAPLFFSYQFQQLATAAYSRKDAPGQLISVDVYRMANPVMAFGVYSAERSPEYQFKRIGGQGYLAPGLCAFWKGDCYVKLATNDRSEAVWPDLLKFARKISAGLPGRAPQPRLLRLFPEEYRIENSELFLAQDVFGHAFLHDGYVAHYKLNEQPTRMFFAILTDRRECLDAYKRLREFFQETGDAVTPLEGIGTEGFVGQEPFYGRSVVFRLQHALAGGLRVPDSRESRRILSELAANLYEYLRTHTEGISVAP